MTRPSPFKHHRFLREIILCAVRWHLRFPLSYQDVVDLLAERDFTVDRSIIYRWVQKFGLALTKRTEKHLRRASVDWFVDETYVRVGGKWRYLWRGIDANGQMVDFRLTARRDAKAASDFLNMAIERVRLHRPVTIVTDTADSYRRVIREINQRYDPHFDSIRHIDRERSRGHETAARIPAELSILANG
ncbi:DDE domain [Puniceibacterium sp. IMCC21224]|nr:DDE domain [Puniceibacterium sp. IMCC21224]